MSTSTDGQLSFGVKFEDGYEFPWDGTQSADIYDGDVNDWWLVQSGWTWAGEKPFTDAGDFAPGFSRHDPRINAYYDSRREWAKTHPCPVELVNYQSGECPAYILAIPGTVQTANRGYPEEIKPMSLVVPVGGREALVVFCEKYGLEFEGEPAWWLSSYWG